MNKSAMALAALMFCLVCANLPCRVGADSGLALEAQIPAATADPDTSTRTVTVRLTDAERNGLRPGTYELRLPAKLGSSVLGGDQSQIQFEIQMATSDLQNAESVRRHRGTAVLEREPRLKALRPVQAERRWLLEQYNTASRLTARVENTGGGGTPRITVRSPASREWRIVVTPLP